MTFARGASWLSGTQVLNLLIMLISRIVLARVLGAQALGAFSAATNAMSVSSRVLSLGTASATQVMASRRGLERGSVVGTSLVLAGGVSLLASAVLLSTLSYFQQWFFSGHPEGMSAMVVMAWYVPVIVLSMNLGVMLIPFGNVRSYALLQIVGGGAFVVPCLILLQFYPPIQAAVISQVIVWSLVLVGTVYFLRDQLKGLRFDSGLAREMVSFGLRSWPNVCLNIGIASFATLFGARYLSPVELSLFVLGMNIVEGLFTPYGAMGQLMLTKVARDQEAGIEKTAIFLRLSVVAFLGMATVFGAVGFWAVPLVFGGEFAPAYAISMALFVTGASHALLKIMANVFSGLGHPQRTTLALAVELTAFFIALPYLASLGVWGLVGASVFAAVVGWWVAATQFCRLAEIGFAKLLLADRGDFDELRTQVRRGGRVEAPRQAA